MATQSDTFQFNFKLGADSAAAVDEAGARPAYDEYDLDAEDSHDQYLYYDPSALQPSEEVQPGRGNNVQTADLEEVEVHKGVVLVKGRVSGNEAAALLKDEQVAQSDLVPGVYEGGFKLWEGAIDMCQYLIEVYHLNPATLLTAASIDTDLQGKRVLELGCGHGLPGILALIAGAEVHFQDFNKEVLTTLTIPNVQANLARLPAGRPRPAARFFSGDWHKVGEVLTSKGFGGYYDLILTSESIYNVASQHRLIECVKQVLQPPLGVVLVAAKSFYFGVGGGIPTFRKTVKHDGIFEVKSVFRTTKDVSAAMRPLARGSGAPPAQQAPPSEAQQEQQQGPDGEQQLEYVQGKLQASSVSSPVSNDVEGDRDECGDAGQAEGEAAGAAGGGNAREVLQLTFPEAILPYFL